MPLRDHFDPPVSQRVSWQEIYGQWPARIVMQLKELLPPGFVSAPSIAFETEIPDNDEYEVRIYDAMRERTLVAVIELVSPGNKDRPEKRNAFVGKCAALLQKGVAVSIVDVVTTRQINLYAELMTFLGQSDPKMGSEPPELHAASCRWIPRGGRAILETWPHILTVGQPLPTLPLWLTPLRVIPLELERSYESACDDLGIQ